MEIYFFPKYEKNGASSRYRIYQFLPFLREMGYSFRIYPLFNERYLSDRYQYGSGRLASIVASYCRRLIHIVRVKRGSTVYIEYELLPFFPGVFELLLLKRRCRVILDYDDAIFHNYDNSEIGVKKLFYKKKISRLMRSASCVIAGNPYIADYARAAGSERVYVLPTVLDLGKYDSAESGVVREKFTIGWIGTPMTVKYLEILRGVLSALYFKDQVRLTLIGCRQFDIPGIEVQTVTWSEETEAQMIRNFDVGVMPLFDGPWERGKCGLKLLQYMACSVPVIASPVGVNVTIVEHGITGFLAHSRREWVEALTVLYEQDKLRLEMGSEGRYHVSVNFDIRSNASILNQILLGTKE